MIGDRLEKLGTRERVGLALAGVALLAVIADQCISGPLGRHTARLQDEIARESARRVLAEGILSTAPAVRKDYEAVAAVVGGPMTKAEMVDRMKSEVGGLAREARMTIVSFKLHEPRALEFCDEYVVEITEFEGDFEGVVQFLYRLSGPGSPYSVKRMALAPYKDGTSVKGSLQISRVSEKAAAGPPAGS